LRRQNSEEGLLSNEIVEQFLDAYRDSFREPSLANQTRAAQVIPENEQALLSTDRYLRQNQKWAKKMRERPLFPSHPSVVEMTRLFFETRSDEDLLSHFEIREAGLASGTLGKMRLLVALAKKDQPQEKLLIENGSCDNQTLLLLLKNLACANAWPTPDTLFPHPEKKDILKNCNNHIKQR
jgi:hypothetical protein